MAKQFLGLAIGVLIGKLLDEVDITNAINSRLYYTVEVNCKENPSLFCALKMWIHTSIEDIDSVSKRRKESFSGQDIYLPCDDNWHRLIAKDESYVTPQNRVIAYFDRSNSYKWTLWIKLIRDANTQLQTIALLTYKEQTYRNQIPQIFNDALDTFRGESLITFTFIDGQLEYRGREYNVTEPIFDEAIEKHKQGIIRLSEVMRKNEGALQKHPDLRACYLLYGPPGTGKTSLAKWIALVAGFDLYEIDVTQPGLNDAQLKKIVSNVPPFSVILFEHIAERLEIIQQQDSNAERINHLTASGFIESLELIPPGAIAFMTTNNVDLLREKIDQKIFRKGRVDKVLEIALPSENQIIRLLRRIAGDEESITQKVTLLARKCCSFQKEPKNMADIAAYVLNAKKNDNGNNWIENALNSDWEGE